ncbi:uncharacterized, partial [Tachysurus ichikawai]
MVVVVVVVVVVVLEEKALLTLDSLHVALCRDRRLAPLFMRHPMDIGSAGACSAFHVAPPAILFSSSSTVPR